MSLINLPYKKTCAKLTATMNISPVDMESRKKLDMRTGDTVVVYQKIKEGDKTRIQQFQGLVIARKHGKEDGATFTVRRTTDGYGVEKIFPLYSPNIDKIEIIKRSKVSRSKLYNIRRQAIKQISKRMKMFFVDIKSDDLEKSADSISEDDSEENSIKKENTDEKVVDNKSTTEEQVSTDQSSTEPVTESSKENSESEKEKTE